MALIFLCATLPLNSDLLHRTCSRMATSDSTWLTVLLQDRKPIGSQLQIPLSVCFGVYHLGGAVASVSQPYVITLPHVGSGVEERRLGRVPVGLATGLYEGSRTKHSHAAESSEYETIRHCSHLVYTVHNGTWWSQITCRVRGLGNDASN
jgi:hypothetical protein